MFVEKRLQNNKSVYYLVHSYREQGKVHKIRKYLGQNLSTVKLKERKQIAEKLILEEIHKYKLMQDPLHFELSKEQLREFKNIQKKIPIKITHLSKKNWKLFSKLFTYNTNAIEGSRLNQKEVSDILEHDKWPDKSKEDIAEAYGVEEALRFIRETKEHISIELIKKIHKIVFKNSKSFAGKLRKKGEEVVVMDSEGQVVHEGAPQTRIRPLLKELVNWYDKHSEKLPGLVLGAIVHNQFENIHPFRDGNGRVGRILLNNVLLKHNLPPLNITLHNRFEYYQSLQSYEHLKDLKPTLQLFLKEYQKLKKEFKKK